MTNSTSERDYDSVARTYANRVTSGGIPACKQVRQACQRYLDDIGNTESTSSFYYDKDKGVRVCRFIELLPHTKGDWAAKRELIRLEPWQVWIVMNVFSFIDRETARRRFTEAMIVVPRKSGKSLLSAAIGLYMMVFDGEFGAEVYCGASTEKQANEVFKPAQMMSRNSPNLIRRFGLLVAAQSMSRPHDGSVFHRLVGKPGDGSSPHCAILDERHEHDDNTLRDAMRTGMGARSQPLMWTITTAGFDLSSPCYDDIMTGRQIIEGTVSSPQSFYVEYTIDADDDWTDMESLRKANPNFGVSVSERFLRDELTAAID